MTTDDDDDLCTMLALRTTAAKKKILAAHNFDMRKLFARETSERVCGGVVWCSKNKQNSHCARDVVGEYICGSFASTHTHTYTIFVIFFFVNIKSGNK